MSNPVFLLVIGVVIVAALAFLLRMAGGGGVETTPPPDEQAGRDTDAVAHEAEAEAETDDGLQPDEDGEELPPGTIAVSSDGLAFVPRRHSVLITSAREVREIIERQRRRRDGTGHATGEAPPVFTTPEPEHPRGNVELQSGDLIATRVLKGAPYIEPWRLETLGRDRDLSDWAFETEEAARAAQETLERIVVRPLFDADGEPIPVGDEDFWAAEQERVKILEAFDQPDEPEEEPGR